MTAIRTPVELLVYAAAVLGAAPLFPHLEGPVQALLVLAAAAGAAGDRGRLPHLNAGWATALGLAVFAFYASRITRTELVVPVINLLGLLLALRLLGEKTPRNCLQILVLALFALASSSLLSLSAAFFVFLVLLVPVVTAGLVLLSFLTADAQMQLERRQARPLWGICLLLPLGSLLLMLGFFVILPRTSRPLWNFLNPAAQATVGFAEQVRPGSFAQLATGGGTAFRARGPRLDPDQLYWRGIVLDATDGRTWRRTLSADTPRELVSGGGEVAMEIALEPRRTPYLITLDPPERLGGLRARRAPDGVFSTSRFRGKRLQYQVTARPGAVVKTRPGFDPAPYLDLPGTSSERLRELALRLKGEGTRAEQIALLQDLFFAQGLVYARTDLPTTADPIDEFLFDKKRGYCEYFASAFATALRLAGVPARLVGGYYGGSYNGVGGYYLVSEDAAHVWVEALTEGGRWVRIDPSRLATNASTALTPSRGRGQGALRNLGDALTDLWNRSVIGYDFDSQLGMLRTGHSWLRPGKVKSLAGRAAALVAVALLAWAAYRGGRRWRSSSAEQRLLRRYLKQVRRIWPGEEISASTGLTELAERLGDDRCRRFAQVYYGALCRDRRLSDGERGELEGLIRALKRF